MELRRVSENDAYSTIETSVHLEGYSPDKLNSALQAVLEGVPASLERASLASECAVELRDLVKYSDEDMPDIERATSTLFLNSIHCEDKDIINRTSRRRGSNVSGLW